MANSMVKMNWKPRNLRSKGNPKSSESGAASRNEKRSRLGNRRDRNLYCSAKGHKQDPARFSEICAQADKLNKVSR